MKKNRNAFFNENNMNYMAYDNGGLIPYQMMQNGSFYASGPNMMMPGANIDNDFSERLAKLERQVNRLDHRISKLENNTISSSEDYESTTNNMYMI